MVNHRTNLFSFNFMPSLSNASISNVSLSNVSLSKTSLQTPVSQTPIGHRCSRMPTGRSVRIWSHCHMDIGHKVAVIYVPHNLAALFLEQTHRPMYQITSANFFWYIMTFTFRRLRLAGLLVTRMWNKLRPAAELRLDQLDIAGWSYRVQHTLEWH